MGLTTDTNNRSVEGLSTPTTGHPWTLRAGVSRSKLRSPSAASTSQQRTANTREIEEREQSSQDLCLILHIIASGSANSVSLRYDPMPGRSRANGYLALAALVSKCESNNKKRRRMFMRQLENVSTSAGQEPDIFFAEVQSIADRSAGVGGRKGARRQTGQCQFVIRAGRVRARGFQRGRVTRVRPRTN